MKIALLLAALFSLPIAALAAPKTAPGVVSIALPGDLAMNYKSGPGQGIAQTYCLTCHSAGYVSMQPPLDEAHWAKEVTKMRKAYGMQIPDADAVAVAAYLARAYGPPTP